MAVHLWALWCGHLVFKRPAGFLCNNTREKHRERGRNRESCSPAWGAPRGLGIFNPPFPGICSPLPDGTPVPTRVPCLLTHGKKEAFSMAESQVAGAGGATEPGWNMQLA